MLFTCKNFKFSDLTWENFFCSTKWWWWVGGGGGWGAGGPSDPPLSLRPCVVRYVKKSKKLLKIAENRDRESLHIFWMTWEIPIEFSGKMWLMIILKVTENQCFIFSKMHFWKNHKGGQSEPSGFLGLKRFLFFFAFCSGINWFITYKLIYQYKLCYIWYITAISL